MTDLEGSYRHCEQIVRQSGSNFAWSFWLLNREKRRAMVALYAFARRTDDIGDGEEALGEKIASLERWEREVHQALDGVTDDPVLLALRDTVTRFKIPAALLFDVIAGVRCDLHTNRFTHRAELDRYCYQVAGAVGLACVHIWGYSSPRALALAEVCGQAFQMTNILRDLKEDAARGRVYLPMDELTLFEYSLDDLLRGVIDERFDRLMEFELARTTSLYQESRAILPYLSPDGRRVFKLMWGRYRAILTLLQANPRAVWERRVSLSWPRKLWVAARQLLSS